MGKNGLPKKNLHQKKIYLNDGWLDGKERNRGSSYLCEPCIFSFLLSHFPFFLPPFLHIFSLPPFIIAIEIHSSPCGGIN